MAIWVSSDWHCKPNALREGVQEWVERGKGANHKLIAAGDLFDILPLGKRKWEDAPSIQQLVTLLGGYPFEYVTGNHDPYTTMARLMAPYPNIKVSKRLEFTVGNREYHIHHGHRWALDWGFLGLTYIAPLFVEFLVDSPLCGVWYWFCRRRGWLASRPYPDAPAGEERERINRITRIIWAGASTHALKEDCCVILGHTHTTGRRERGMSKEKPPESYMVDDGNLPDGSYVEITDDARLKFL